MFCFNSRVTFLSIDHHHLIIIIIYWLSVYIPSNPCFFSHIREYCNTSHRHAQVTLLLLELSIDLRDWPSVHDTIARAERTVVAGTTIAGGMSGVGGGSSSIAGIGASMTSLSSDGIAHEEYDISLFHNKLKAAQGIAYLSEGKYKEAASTFTSISSELTNQFSSVISAEDLALYGALLGWATYDRETVCEVVMEGEFKARLEVSVCVCLCFGGDDLAM